MQTMKDGAVLCNAGHFNVEIEVDRLMKHAKNSRKARHNIVGYQMDNGNWIYLLAEGRLVNLGSRRRPSGGDHGHELCYPGQCRIPGKHKGNLDNKVIAVLEEIDNRVARKLLRY